jgi:hypothetical protein
MYQDRSERIGRTLQFDAFANRDTLHQSYGEMNFPAYNGYSASRASSGPKNRSGELETGTIRMSRLVARRSEFGFWATNGRGGPILTRENKLRQRGAAE